MRRKATAAATKEQQQQLQSYQDSIEEYDGRSDYLSFTRDDHTDSDMFLDGKRGVMRHQ